MRSGVDGLVGRWPVRVRYSLTLVCRLRGPDARATYEVTDLDAGTARRVTGRDLMRAGLQVTVDRIPWAAIVLYRKLPRE